MIGDHSQPPHLAEGPLPAQQDSSDPRKKGVPFPLLTPTPPEGTPEPPARTPAAQNQQRSLGKLLLFATWLGGGAAVLLWTPLGQDLDREGILRWVEALRGWPWAPAVFVPAYTVAVALGLPGSALTLAGGAIFGLGWGTLFNWLGANLGANLAYLLARTLGREGLVRLVGSRKGGRQALARMDETVASHGFRTLLILRLLPPVPFNMLNFAGGLVGIPWVPYALATALGILPGAFVYTLFADALLEGSTQASREALLRLAAAGLLLLALIFLPRRLFRREMD